MSKPSLFQRITGSVSARFDEYAEEVEFAQSEPEEYEIESSDHLNLAVDVYQTPDAIILRAFTPGVTPGSVELSLTRDMLTIDARRESDIDANDEDYFTRELDWRPLHRTILLPSEVDIDNAEATETRGVLTIRMPKINKDRQTKVKVRSR
jgi:HSP20 family protein